MSQTQEDELFTSLMNADDVEAVIERFKENRCSKSCDISANSEFQIHKVHRIMAPSAEPTTYDEGVQTSPPIRAPTPEIFPSQAECDDDDSYSYTYSDSYSTSSSSSASVDYRPTQAKPPPKIGLSNRGFPAVYKPPKFDDTTAFKVRLLQPPQPVLKLEQGPSKGRNSELRPKDKAKPKTFCTC